MSDGASNDHPVWEVQQKMKPPEVTMVCKGTLRSGSLATLLSVVMFMAAPSVSAQIPVPGCVELTPTLTARQASFRCKGGVEGSCEVDKWRIRGQFTMFASPEDPFDPATQEVALIFNQIQGELFSPVLTPGTFLRQGSDTRPTWVFRLRRRDPYVENAEGWGKAKFRAVKLTPISGAANRVRYSLRGGENEEEAFVIDTSASPILLRETMVFSEPEGAGGEEILCVSYILTCEKHRYGSALRCFSLVNPSPSGAFLDAAMGVLD